MLKGGENKGGGGGKERCREEREREGVKSDSWVSSLYKLQMMVISLFPGKIMQRRLGLKTCCRYYGLN